MRFDPGLPASLPPLLPLGQALEISSSVARCLPCWRQSTRSLSPQMLEPSRRTGAARHGGWGRVQQGWVSEGREEEW